MDAYRSNLVYHRHLEPRHQRAQRHANGGNLTFSSIMQSLCAIAARFARKRSARSRWNDQPRCETMGGFENSQCGTVAATAAALVALALTQQGGPAQSAEIRVFSSA